VLQQAEKAAAVKSPRTVVDGPMSARPSIAFTAASGKRPPWKGSDPAPRDTWRNNYLDNEDEVEKVNRL
jgi:hypothetical protein